MIPIIGTFFGGKKATQSPPLKKACFNYTFFNGSGAAKVAFGVKCDGSEYVQIITLGGSATQCLFEDTARSGGLPLTITKGAQCF